MKRITTLLLLVLSAKMSIAQGWSISKKSGEINFGAIVHIESVYAKPGTKGLTDTLFSTGFLLKDKGRVYIVTTKHFVQLDPLGSNQQMLNTNISFTTSPVNNNKVKMVKLPALPVGKDKPYLLSADGDDIAVISFQSKAFKSVMAVLLKDQGRPLPVYSLDLSADRYPDEDFYHPSYMVYKSKTGATTWAKGVGTAKIKTYDEASPTFITGDYTSAGSNGSPLFINDKIIGMVLHGEDIEANADAVKDPFQKSKTAVVIKATRILPLVRKMQEMEKAAGF